MAYNLTPLKGKIDEIGAWLSQELSGVRTGKASPLLLDSVMVDNYGAKTSIKFIASITVEDAKSLRITPWDKSHVGPIETAIAQSNLGLSTTPDQSGLRVIFPELTEDRRKMLIKMVGEKMEEAKISLRKERERFWNDIQDKEKAGEISEDEKFRLKDELQKMIDKGSDALEAIIEKKKTEIAG